MEINGKTYPLWGQLVERKAEYIGGRLIATDMGITEETEIVDVVLEPNGDDSALFGFMGKDFNCQFDVHYGGISGDPDASDDRCLNFCTTYSGTFKVCPK